MFRYFAEGAFSSRHMNLLNLHLGIVNFSQYLRLAFNVVFFADMGMTPAQICLAMGALLGGRWIFRTPLILVPHRFGSKGGLIVGQILLAIAFLMYRHVEGLGPWLWASLALMSAGEALYWHTVHTTFATLAEHGKFGRQLAARGIFMGIGGMLAPVTAALVQGVGHWSGVFVLATASVMVSLIPLLMMPEPCPPGPVNWRQGMRVNKAGFRLFMGWGVLGSTLSILWPMIVFLEIGTVEKYGWLMSSVALLSFVVMIVVGRRIDMGKGQKAVVYGCIAYAGALGAQALLGHTPLQIMFFSVLTTLAMSLFSQPFNASLYRWAKETRNPLWFHYWSEFGWDLGCAFCLFGAAACLTLMPGLSLRWLMLLSFPAIFWCARVYLRDGNAPAPAPTKTADLCPAGSAP